MERRVYHIIIILLLLLSLCACLTNFRKETIVKEVRTIDTIYSTKVSYDTITIKEIVYKDKHIVDTVYVKTDSNSVVILPVLQKHYGIDNLYDIWISGIEPLNMDSITVYPKTINSTTTVYEDKIVYKETKKPTLFIGGGFYSFSDTFTPNIGVSLSIRQKWLISANYGFNGEMYDINVKYKLF